jgi:hypothetical protein
MAGAITAAIPAAMVTAGKRGRFRALQGTREMAKAKND